jgi:glutathione S-transferase
MAPEKVAERLQRIPDPARLERIKQGIELGTKSPGFATAVRDMEYLLRAIDNGLSDGRPWLMGEQFTLADSNFVPYCHRLQQMDLAWMFEPFPRFQDWYDRVKDRQCFTEAFLKPEDDPDTQRFKENGRKEGPVIREILR